MIGDSILFRWALVISAIAALLLMFLFQRVDWINALTNGSFSHPYAVFVMNKTIRFLVNDMACLLLIHVIFRQTNYLRFAWKVFWFESLVVLPIYFVFKLTIEGESELSSPLLSQIHRLVVNPILMIVLMAAFYYQRTIEKKS